LQSLQEQTLPANQVIVVDGSDQPIESEIKQFLSPSVSYMRVFPPSLTKQRNEGIKALGEDITLVGYLDDDIVLEKDAVGAMLRFWEHCADDIGGSSFNITNTSPSRLNLFGKLFCKLFYLNDGRQGVVLRSGINQGVSPVLKDTYTDWLCGGATIWQRQVVEEVKYDEWFKGWAYVEDVDFSFTVSKRYKLVVVQSARVQHLPPPFASKKLYSLGRVLTTQRYHLVKKHSELSVGLFYWATVGQIISGFLYGIMKRRLDPIRVALGNIAGLFDIIIGNPTQVDEQFRV